MKQNTVIGQKVNVSDSVTEVENKTVIETAVQVTGNTLPIDTSLTNKLALTALLSGITGVAIPERAKRAVKKTSRYLLSRLDIITLGLKAEADALAGTIRLEVDTAPDAECLLETLTSYFKRTSFSVKCTDLPNTENVIYQVVTRPSMQVVSSREFAKNDFEARIAYLKEYAPAREFAFVKADGRSYLVAFGSKTMLFAVQQIRETGVAI